jgi:hypothetical protein
MGMGENVASSGKEASVGAAPQLVTQLGVAHLPVVADGRTEVLAVPGAALFDEEEHAPSRPAPSASASSIDRTARELLGVPVIEGVV